MATQPNTPPLGAGLRLAPSARTTRLDHEYFEHEVRPMLGSILLKKGWITPERLDAALEERGNSGMRLGEILLSRGWIFEGELAHALAEQFDLPYIDLGARSFDPTVAALLPLEVARRLFAVPVRFVGEDGIQVAIADPTDVDADLLERVLKHPIQLVVAERSQIQIAWRNLQR
jgi:type II secretion system (T2SS) protein E